MSGFRRSVGTFPVRPVTADPHPELPLDDWPAYAVVVECEGAS
jgi:hypothetical protein